MYRKAAFAPVGLKICLCFLFIFSIKAAHAQVSVMWDETGSVQKPVITGAEQTDRYIPYLLHKRVALLINNTSRIGSTLLADSLAHRGIQIAAIFAPEHGFRGNASAGEAVNDSFDASLHVPIISLYGKHVRPTTADLVNVDAVVYDIQDVGCRFYTYIATLQYMLEACADAHIPLLILDRPNPNGHYIDGPVLDTSYRSFVGMQPIPVVYGMTSAEYASMLIGERWLHCTTNPEVLYITCKHYTHHTLYRLPVPPSPNLREMKSIYLYPSLCFFEGTQVSVGRGTDKPFMQFGFPKCKTGFATFTPTSTTGANHPPYENQLCKGIDLSAFDDNTFAQARRLNVQYVLDMYAAYPDKTKFFNKFFDQLAGGPVLRKQITQNLTESQIRLSWQDDIKRFKQVRKKYLFYTDFE